MVSHHHHRTAQQKKIGFVIKRLYHTVNKFQAWHNRFDYFFFNIDYDFLSGLCLFNLDVTLAYCHYYSRENHWIWNFCSLHINEREKILWSPQLFEHLFIVSKLTFELNRLQTNILTLNRSLLINITFWST